MRIGQTSFVVFVSELASSVLGFAATLYLSRVLGAEVLGYFALVLVIANWLSLVGNVGISTAVTKRLSENADPSEHFTAGVTMVGTLAVICIVGTFVFRPWIDGYVGVESAGFVALLVLSGLSYGFIRSSLEGERLVHVAGLLSTLRVGARSFAQITLVFAGFGLTGVLVGYATGGFLAGLVGVVFLSVSPKIPHLDHFRSLLDFGKFSWLGSLSGRVFNQVDVLVLGVFVSPALVGVYSIAWNLTSFIGAFGSSIQQSTFPELSRASAEERLDMVGDVVTDSIAFTGLLAIPGLFGGVLLGDRILRLYGEEFVQGTAVLGLLILAMLIWDYMNQLLTTLNAIDRPDLAFRVNAVFVVLNVVLNVALVFRFGWVGAAVATVASTTVGLLLAFHYLRGLVGFSVPVFELGRQVAAGLMMAVVVSSVRRGIEVFDLLNHNAATVAILVTLGAAAYFLALAAISDRFRATLRDNAPVELPFH